MIKAILFDYGGTIDSRAEHWSEIIYRGWKSAGLDCPKDLFRECYVYGERWLEAHPESIRPTDNYYDTILVKARAELECLAQKTGQPVADAEEKAQEIARYCSDYAQKCVNEVKPVLEALAQKYPMALVSNFYGNVEAVITAYGIRPLFQFVIDSTNVDVRKPDPRIFGIAVERLALKPEEVLVVGDSLRKDVLCGEALGCKAVWIKGIGWSNKDDDAVHDPTIKKLDELLQIIPLS